MKDIEKETESPILTAELEDTKPPIEKWDDKHASVSKNSSAKNLIEKANTAITDAGEEVAAKTSELTAKAKSKLQATSQTAVDHISSARDQVVTSSSEAKKTVQSTFEKHPLAFLAGTLAAGVILGCAIPRSTKEKSLLKEPSKKLRDTAEDLKETAIANARAVADDATETLKEKVESI